MKLDENDIKLICDSMVANYPDKDCDSYKMLLSLEVLRAMMGDEWTNQAIFPNNHHVTSKTVLDAVNFLQTNRPGFVFQERVSKLAVHLYNIRDVVGLQKVIDEIKSGNIYGGYAELEAGDFLLRRNIPFEFVIPSGQKGQDFDIKINTNYTINCEVKHKIESTHPSKEALEATLSAANKQVPKNQPALFFIKVPISWIRHADFRGIVERTKGTFFPRNENVLGFILYWEETVQGGDGMFHWKYKFEKNSRLSVNVGNIQEELTAEVEPLDTFVYELRKHIKKCQDYLSYQ